MEDPHCKNAGASAQGDKPCSGWPVRRTALSGANRAWLGALAVAAVVASAPARAALGENANSIEADRLQVRASVRQVGHAAFTVHELTTEMNGVVREYVAPGGRVFAITWHSPTKPNLQQFLGTHFDTVAAAPRRRAGERNRFAMSSGNLVFESAGHMRSFHGRAYLSNAIPSGVSVNDIQ